MHDDLEKEIAERESYARSLADAFARKAGRSVTDATNARTAALYIQHAEIAATLMPKADADRLREESKGLESDARNAVEAEVARGVSPEEAVKRAISVVDEIHRQGSAELRGYALKAWLEACAKLEDML